MLEIASQITICLLIAAVIGFIIGYIVAKSQSAKADIAEEITPLNCFVVGDNENLV